jgi:signal transduction histidine kinase
MPFFLPFFDRENTAINDGQVFTYHDFCKNHFGKKCINHYQRVTEPGFQECPYGFFTYATRYSLGQEKIYGSLVLVGRRNRKLKARGILKNRFHEEELVRLVSIAEQTNKRLADLSESIDQESEIIRSVFHEIRRFSRDLDDAGTFFQKFSIHADETDKYIIDNILHTIKLISIRIDSYELLKNPETITSGRVPNIKVYKKFDKSRYILTSKAREKNIYINFHNESHFSIDGFEVFDLLPYILLDNAVKYSPPARNIDVDFFDDVKTVKVSSIGPRLDAEEHQHLFERGFRGRHCNNYQGSGLGLNMLKQICNLHGIEVEANSERVIETTEAGVPFSAFEVVLKF